MNVTERSKTQSPHTHCVCSCHSCGEFVLGNRQLLETIVCCNQPLREQMEPSLEIDVPTIESISQDVFGLPQCSFEIARCTTELGTATVAEVTEVFDKDRSVITRYLNQLEAVGILNKTTRLLERGGDVNVYYPYPVPEMNRSILLSLYHWAAMASRTVDRNTHFTSRTELDIESPAEKLATVYW